MNAALTPAGSCKANSAGPVADGVQLSDITQNPGITSSDSGSGGTSNNGACTAAASLQNSTSSQDSSATLTPTSAVTTSTADSGSVFVLQNGLDAQKLNAQFTSLTSSSSCQSIISLSFSSRPLTFLFSKRETKLVLMTVTRSVSTVSSLSQSVHLDSLVPRFRW